MARTETVTVMFTDLVGSTEMAGRLGHDDYEAFRQGHFTALRGAAAAHNGVEVKSTGDGLMLSFASTADAVACGVAMQQATSKARLRVGVSSGEATQVEADLYGPPVTEAARLCAAAAAGQILVSDIVRLLARGKGHTFTSVGELSLKGLVEAVPASEVAWAPLTAGVPLPPRLASAHAARMVGRNTEQDVIAGAWAEAREGRRQVVLLSGEPGIGKTRLATETACAAHADGAVVLLGSCDEDIHLPYQSFVEALRHYVVHAPEDVLAAHVLEHNGELGRLVPELARRVGNLPAPQVAEAETERYLFFDAVAGLLAAASRQQPVVLLLDDLQWAGAPELLLLKHILRSPLFSSDGAAQPPGDVAGSPPRLLILGTYRDSDLTRTHPLTAVLADLRRVDGVQRVALHGLDDSAVVALMESAAGHSLDEPGRSLAAALQRETEGSPFFIGEILRHLTESGALARKGDRWVFEADVAGLEIPEGVKEVVGRRLARLSEATNRILSLAAVVGRQFDVALLTRISDESEDAVLDAMDEATAAALVTEIPGRADSFSFSHALVRTTLYEELSGARRARLHRRVGEELEELTASAPGTRIDELAHHWLSATQVVDRAKAIGYARLAGDHALASLAFEEAEAHYQRALEALGTGDRGSDELRCDLLLALAGSQNRSGDSRYRTAVAAAVEVARALGDGERLALAALANARPGGFISNANLVDEELIGLYEEACAGLDDADSLLRARVLGQLAVEMTYTSTRERRHALSREAVAIARRLGDDAGLGQILVLHLLAITDPFTLAERLECTRELAALASRAGSSELAYQAAFHRTAANFESGDIEGAERSLAETKRLAGQLRLPFYIWWSRVGRSALAIMRGAPDAEQQTLAALEMSMANGNADGALCFGAQLVSHRSNQGRNAELIDSARANVENQPHLPAWRAVLARLATTTDQMAEAHEQIAVLAATGFDFPMNWTWPGLMLSLTEAVADLDDAASAAVLYEQVRPVAGQAAATSSMVVWSGSFAMYCGMLATCLGRTDDAERHFVDALAMNERLGARPFVVRTRRAWASMLLQHGAAGDAGRARELIVSGLAEAETLGMAREVELLQRLQAQLDEAA